MIEIRCAIREHDVIRYLLYRCSQYLVLSLGLEGQPYIKLQTTHSISGPQYIQRSSSERHHVECRANLQF